MHPFINFGLFQLPAMGFSILCGTALGLALIFLLRKKTPIAPQHIMDGLIWTILLGFAGMKVLYWIVTPPAWPTTWAQWQELLTTGMVFYGGLLGGVLGIFICSRVRKVHFMDYSDLFAPAFCLAHAGGRVGCLLSGCCYGIEHHGACAVVLDGVPRLPIPIFEAAFLVLLGGALTFIFLRVKARGAEPMRFSQGFSSAARRRRAGVAAPTASGVNSATGKNPACENSSTPGSQVWMGATEDEGGVAVPTPTDDDTGARQNREPGAHGFGSPGLNRRGLVTAVYMLAYAVWRFVIEFFRGDAERGFIGPLSTSQFISIFILLAGLGFLYYSFRKTENGNKEIRNEE